MYSLLFFVFGGAFAVSSCIAYDTYKENERLMNKIEKLEKKGK